MRGAHAGDLTLEQLEKKFDKFSREMPGLTKKALKKGTKVLREEMRRRYTAAGLRRRSGDLYEAITILNLERIGRKVKAAVGVGVVKKHSQVYKAVAHELGMVVGHGVTLPRRAFVEPTKRAKLRAVQEMILSELIGGYSRV